MPMDKLLVCVDGSRNAEEAVRYAVGMAKEHDLMLSLMYVWTPPAAAGQHMDALEDVPDEELEPIRGARRLIEEAGVGYRLVKALGDPAEEILEESTKGYGLAILGSSDLGRVDRFLMGSVVGKVSHRITIPLMIVPPGGP